MRFFSNSISDVMRMSKGGKQQPENSLLIQLYIWLQINYINNSLFLVESNESPRCSPAWDSLICWPSADPMTLVTISCRVAFEAMELAWPSGLDPSLHLAHRACDQDGQWSAGNWTNYTECLDIMEPDSSGVPPNGLPTALMVAYILFGCSIVSLLFMAATLFIFCYFK